MEENRRKNRKECPCNAFPPCKSLDDKEERFSRLSLLRLLALIANTNLQAEAKRLEEGIRTMREMQRPW
jgi:hypothetical protein